MKKIDKLRSEIDLNDEGILKLILKRIEKTREIAEYKKTRGGKIYRPEREEKILRKMKKNLGREQSKIVENVFRTIISNCRAVQKTLKISYLGPKATFTHQAAIKIFGEFCNFAPAQSVSEVFNEIETDRAEYGVVPIENSTEGMISHTLDMFIDSPLKIINEEFLAISHCLISSGKSVKKIKKLYSHPSAFAQCRDFVSKNFAASEKIETSSTAGAVKLAGEAANAAAIASRFAAEIYKMNILAEHIEDISQNYTRFLVLGKTTPEPSGKDKTSLLFSLKDRPGSLHDSLVPFKKRNINLTKIESRPSRKKPWEYLFFVDCTGHTNQKKIQAVIKELAVFCNSIKILGSYPAGDSNI
ncbi:MAG: prephenate dehydratase [bacterium]